MGIIEQAQAKLELLKCELSRLEMFLATAYELQQEFGAPVIGASLEGRPTVRRSRSRATGSGSGSSTLRVVSDALRERGAPMTSRELLPIVLAKGISVGGKSQLGTLSARISQKGVVESKDNKWWFIDGSEPATAPTLEDQAVDTLTQDQPPVSTFAANTKGGEADADTTD